MKRRFQGVFSWRWRSWYRHKTARLAVGIALVALIAGAVLGGGSFLVRAAAGGGQPHPRATIHGHLIPALQGMHALRPMNGGQTLDLTIVLSPRNQAQLSALIAAQNDRTSPLYHHYLTPQDYAQQFAPTQATVDAIKSFLSSQGLRVGSVSANHLLIHVSGAASAVEQAFATQISDFALGSRVVYAPTVEPSVPANFASQITAIAGLDDVAQLHSHARRPKPHTAHNGSGPNGSGYSPSDLQTAYDMTPLTSSNNGAGQTIALVEFDGYWSGDINYYLNYYGLGSPKYSNVLIDGATNSPGAGAIEVELDMEAVSAIAPGANQLVYIAPNTPQDGLDLYSQIASDNTAKIVSTSWGLCEKEYGNSYLQAEDNIFQQSAAEGQAIFAAAGDDGAIDCYASSNGSDTSLQVDSPASDPNVIGVGGTSLNTGTGGSYGSESVWNNQYGAGGGGLSTYFAQPFYQSGPGVKNSFSNGKREVPDVSADADPNTGYSVYCSQESAGCPFNGADPTASWIEVGGTSAATPLWAGVAADMNQYLIAQGAATLGASGNQLYRIFNTNRPYSAYHDITVGNNFTSQHYPATSGYDLASGMGTPDVWHLAQDLAAALPHIQVSQPSYNLVTAPGISPSAQTFTLQNTGIGTLRWSASGVPTWAPLSATSGTLAPGASQSLTVNFNTASYTTPQTLTATITISDPRADNNPVTIPLVVVITAGQKTWYFAEGSTAGSFTEFLAMENPNNATAHVQVQYLLDKGGPVVKQYTINPHSRATLLVNQEVGNGHAVSMVVTSQDQPIVAERPMYFTYPVPVTGPAPGGSDIVGATSLTTDFYFSYLDTRTGYVTFLTILNQQTSAMTATVSYYPAAGGAPIVRPFTINAQSRGTILVNAVSGLPAGTYSAHVNLSAPGLVERILYVNDPHLNVTGGAAVVGTAQPQPTWYFAEGLNTPPPLGFQEEYVLSNPSSSASSTATITYSLPDGSQKATTVTLVPGQQQIVQAATALGTQGNIPNSVVVTTTGAPVIAERVQFFRYGAIPGMTDVLGTSAPGYLFEFAEGYTGGKYTEYLTAENPNQTQTASVTILLYPANGSTPTVVNWTIAPHSRSTLTLNRLLPNASFSMRIISTVPIVAERPLYFVYGSNETGGTDVIGFQPAGSTAP